MVLPTDLVTGGRPAVELDGSRRHRNQNLWGEDVFGVGFDLDGGEAGGVPAAAESFDQEDAGD